MGALASKSPYPDLFEHSSSSTKRGSTSSAHPPVIKRQTSLAQAPDNDAPASPIKSKSKQPPSRQQAHEVAPSCTPKLKPTASEHPASTTKAQRMPNTPRVQSNTRTAPRQPQTQSQARSQPPPAPSGAVQQRVIRRVKAVISVPVKEEELSDAEPFEESDASGSAYEPEDEQPVRKRANGRTSTGGRRRSQASRIVNDEDEEEEKVPDHHHRRRSRYIPDDDDDTDELAMGPNVCQSVVDRQRRIDLRA